MNHSDWVIQLIDYVDTFDKTFSQSVLGAPIGEILSLEKDISRQLPEVHKVYLERFGSRDGGLFAIRRADTSIGALRSYVHDVRADFLGISFDNSVPFATGDVYEGLGLDLTSSSTEPTVCELESGDCRCFAAKSLPALCFRTAFLFEQASLSEHSLTLERFDDAYSVADVRNACRPVGFVEQWFSDQDFLAARAGKCLLVATLGGPGRTLRLDITAKSRTEMSDTLARFHPSLPFRQHRWTRNITLQEARSEWLDS